MKRKSTYILTLLFYSTVAVAQQGDGGRWSVCRLDSIYDYSWDTISQGWIPQSKILRAYDVNRYLTNANVQKWNGSDYDMASQKDTFSYDANGNFVKDVTQIRNGSAWLTFQALYTYNGNNQKTGMLYQKWNGSAWDDLQQSTYTYDGSGYLIGQTTQAWNGTQWQNTTKYNYTNNANGKPASLIVQTWSAAQWVNYRQYTYTYDANDYETNESIRAWDGSQFTDLYQDVFTNNSSGFHDEMLMTQWANSSWRNYRKTDYYHYCLNNTGIADDITTPTVIAYPNPFVDKLTVAHDQTYELYDLLGKQVDESKLRALPSGTYILKTRQGVTRVMKGVE